MTTCSESGQVRKEAAIRSLCRASESIERTGAFWCRDMARPAARYLVSRWSSASPAGSLDYQTPRRRPGPVVQKSPVKARLSNLIYPLRNAACWRCLGIDGCVVQEAAVLLLDFLQLKRPVSLGWGNGPFLFLGSWISEDNNRWQLFRVLDAACGCGGYSEACGGDCCECDCARRCVACVCELAGLAAARVRLLGGVRWSVFAGCGRAGGLCRFGRLR